MKRQEFFCRYIVLCIVSNYEVFINCYRKNYSCCLCCLFTKTASKNCFNSFCTFIWTILLPKTNKAQVQSNAPSSAQCLWELFVSPKTAVWPVFIDQNTFSGTLKDVVNIVINELLKYLFCVRYFPLHLECWRRFIMTLFDRVTFYISWFSKHPSLSIRPCMLCCDCMRLESQELKQAILKFFVRVAWKLMLIIFWIHSKAFNIYTNIKHLYLHNWQMLLSKVICIALKILFFFSFFSNSCIPWESNWWP